MTGAGRFRWLARGTSLAVCVVLAACSHTPRKRINTDFAERNWEIRRSTLLAVQRFQLRGRLVESGITGVRADMDWTQDEKSFEAHFFGPLGVGAATIRGERKLREHDGDRDGRYGPEYGRWQVEIVTKEGTTRTERPEGLMQDRLGWSLPLENLRYWLLGLPVPKRGFEREPENHVLLDDAGRPARVREDGWQIEYGEYQTIGAVDLPRKLTLANESKSFRIVIDEWTGIPVP